MSLAIPPRSLINNRADTVGQFEHELTAVIAGHARATNPWTFYEQIDAWLGPWGMNGYPIGYGKFYCVQFNSNQSLQRNAITRDWLRRTTVLLQEAIRDYLVARLTAGTIAALTEPELRQAAFNSHPQCYDRAGLQNVIVLAPHLTLVIMTIPGVEFVPFHGSAVSTYAQAIETAILEVIHLASIATNPAAHVRNAFRQDQREFLSEIQMGQYLASIEDAISRDQIQQAEELQRIIRSLERIESNETGLLEYVRQLITKANEKLIAIRQRNAGVLNGAAPALQQAARRRFPQSFP